MSRTDKDLPWRMREVLGRRNLCPSRKTCSWCRKGQGRWKFAGHPTRTESKRSGLDPYEPEWLDY